MHFTLGVFVFKKGQPVLVENSQLTGAVCANFSPSKGIRTDGEDAMDDAIQQQGQALDLQAHPAAFSVDFSAEADAYLDG